MLELLQDALDGDFNPELSNENNAIRGVIDIGEDIITGLVCVALATEVAAATGGLGIVLAPLVVITVAEVLDTQWDNLNEEYIYPELDRRYP